MIEPTQSDRFLSTYKLLDSELRERLGFESTARFSEVISESKNRRLINDSDARFLRKAGDLRNAIVHDDRNSREVIAEPHEEVVQRLESILGAVTKPLRVDSIAAKPVYEFSTDDPLKTALDAMQSGDYSQLVVRSEGRLQLLTTDGIASWIEDNYDDDGIILEPATVGDVLRYERPRRFKLVPRKMTQLAAMGEFRDAAAWTDDRLFALLVTHSGKASEKCVGIVTPSDAFKHHSQ